MQSIRVFSFLDESVERFSYTEVWRVQPNSKIEQQGDDDFLVPWHWMRDHSGRFYIIAYASYQESLNDDFVCGASNDLCGRLMGTPYIKMPPEGTQVLERIWQARWAKGGEVSFEVIQ